MPPTRPDSPTPTSPPVEEDPQLVDLPGFQHLPPSPPPDPLDPTTTTTGTTPPASPPVDDDDGWDDDEVVGAAHRPAATPSSRASTDWRDLAPLTEALVGVASMLVRWVRSRRRMLAEGVWIADEEDQAAIGQPLARIAARRSPITGEGAADTADGLTLLVGTASYAMKNLQAEVALADLAAVDEPAGG